MPFSLLHTDKNGVFTEAQELLGKLSNLTSMFSYVLFYSDFNFFHFYALLILSYSKHLELTGG